MKLTLLTLGLVCSTVACASTPLPTKAPPKPYESPSFAAPAEPTARGVDAIEMTFDDGGDPPETVDVEAPATRLTPSRASEGDGLDQSR